MVWNSRSVHSQHVFGVWTGFKQRYATVRGAFGNTKMHERGHLAETLEQCWLRTGLPDKNT